MKDILIYFTSPMVLFAVLLVLVMLYFIINRPKEDKPDDAETVAITTRDMLQDINKERREKGLYEFQKVLKKIKEGDFRVEKSEKNCRLQVRLFPK